MVCNLCYVRLRSDQPGVKRSTIPGAGNGLFANKDYAWGEVVTWYKGSIHVKRPQHESSYILYRDGVWIDGKKGFTDGLGRYINGTLNGRKPNVYFGYAKLGFDVPIRVFTKTMAKKKGISTASPFGLKKNEEILVNYGSTYWKKYNAKAK